LCVCHKTEGSAAAEGAVEEKIEGVKVREFEPLYVAFYERAEVLFDGVGGDFTDEDRVILIFESDEAYIGGVAFVAGACVRKFS
jgi:hypothetical protein